MNNFDIIWKFAIIGFLLAITVSLETVKTKIDSMEKVVKECLLVPEPELPILE